MTTGSAHLPRFHSLSRPKSQGWEMGTGRRGRTEVSQRTLLVGEGVERKYYWQEKPPYCALGMAWNVFTLLFLVAQSCLTLCTFTDCSLPGSSVHGIFLARIWNGCHFHLQGIFLTQGSNLGLLHWQADPLPLSCLGSPFSGYKPSMLLIV